LPDDIEMIGSPKNFETGIWENWLIYVGKQHASSIQKWGPKIFTRQLGNQIHVKHYANNISNLTYNIYLSFKIKTTLGIKIVWQQAKAQLLQHSCLTEVWNLEYKTILINEKSL
jgi:hypothetical protein